MRWAWVAPGEMLPMHGWHEPAEGESASDASDGFVIDSPEHVVVATWVCPEKGRLYNARCGFGEVLFRGTVREAVDEVRAEARHWKGWVEAHHGGESLPKRYVAVAQEHLRLAEAAGGDGDKDIHCRKAVGFSTLAAVAACVDLAGMREARLEEDYLPMEEGGR